MLCMCHIMKINVLKLIEDKEFGIASFVNLCHDIATWSPSKMYN